MGIVASRALKYSVDGIAFECNLKTLNRDWTNEVVESDAFCQVGPITHVNNYKWGTSIGGDNDFVANSVDDTLFGLVGSDTGVATVLNPTGASVGANTPHFTGSEKLESYQITAGLNQMVGYSAKLRGDGASTRATA